MLPKRVYAKINLDNIQKNVGPLVEKLSPNVTVMGIVKADGYGHGAVEVANALNEVGVGAFGVATIGEAVELRNNGITSPILVLGQIFKENFRLAVENNISLTVFDSESAKELSQIALSLKKNVNVHIKIDTGMGRIGFRTNDEGYSQIKEIFALGGLNITGAFTHFSSADCHDKTFTLHQRDLFVNFTDKLIKEGFALPVRHMFNSASILELTGYCGEMVRSGIMTYGLYPSSEMNKEYKLYPAMELKSSVAFIKDVPKDFTVSYGCTYVTEKEMKIATIPVGYGDGYPRYLSNKGEVLIKGTRCKILGRVCMDQFMVDVSHISDLEIGDEVTLIGTDGNETITIEDVSDENYRFNYEFCCLISDRVPRVYIKNGKVIKVKDHYNVNK